MMGVCLYDLGIVMSGLYFLVCIETTLQFRGRSVEFCNTWDLGVNPLDLNPNPFMIAAVVCFIIASTLSCIAMSCGGRQPPPQDKQAAQPSFPNAAVP